MPLDAICLAAVASELNLALQSGKIDKVLQPGKDEIHLALRSSQGNIKLLLSASPQNPRVHITWTPRENPASPPMFCMFLRKHLTGAKFVSVTQPPMERTLVFRWMAKDEMGSLSQKDLVCEIMGRHSNLILVDSDGRILDCLRRVDFEMSEKRQVLPGMFYRLPPSPDKQNLTDMTNGDILKLWEETGRNDDKWALETFLGISPLIARELCFRGLPQSLLELADDIKKKKFKPVLLAENIENGEYKDFSFRDIRQYNDFYKQIDNFDSFSRLLDSFYTKRDTQMYIKQRSQGLVKYATNQRDRIVRKLAAQTQELIQSQNSERLRETGDLLMANLHIAARGMTEVTVEDFYSETSAQTKILLDADKNPQQNAAKYYKEYAKAKTAKAVLGNQIERGNADLAYWESVIDELSRITSEKELEEIRDEIQPVARKKIKTKPSAPYAFVSSDGVSFYAGRNNRQNDELTMKTADKNDMWLHVQKIPGCHVIIDTSQGKPGEQTIFEAASVAAFYSQAAKSPKVTVDYTFVKNVKKPVGAKPGMVIYDKFSSILVEPNEKLTEQLKRKQ